MNVLIIILKTLTVFITISCVFAKEENLTEKSKTTWLLLMTSILLIMV